MSAIASLEDLKASQEEGEVFTLRSMRSAICCMKMAPDRVEECLQASAEGKDSRTVER